jgi:hypothetical protein
MKKPMQTMLVCALLVFSLTVNAKNYYLSNSGNDSNTGTDPSSPWQTINKLNSFKNFLPGDNIYFNKGDTFWGSITISNSGTAGNPITIGAYGAGANPVITGFTSISEWTNQGNNIWISNNPVSTTLRLNLVLANGIYAPLGRFPNTGWATYQSQSVTGNNEDQQIDSVTIVSNDLTVGPNWTGAEIFIYGNPYAFDKCRILNQSGNTIGFKGNYKPVYDTKNPSFIIQDDVKTLDSQNEWYYNPSTKKLQIYSIGNPSNIQVATVDNLVALIGKSYITIDGIQFKGSNGNLIQLNNSKYITIKNCSADYSGLDAINGVGSSSTGLLVDNCAINHTNNYGIKTNASYDYAVIKNSTLKNIGWVPGMTGITAMGIDAQGANTLIGYNRLDSLCYVGIQFLGDRTVVSNNYITNFNIFLTDGGGIYTWNGWGGVVKSNIKILNNIIINQHTHVEDIGIYLDDWSNNIEVNGNTVKGCGWGISGGNVFDIKYLNNTSFDNDKAQLFLLRNPTQPVAGKKGLDNITTRNNILFVKLPINNGVGSHSMFISDASSGSVLPTNSSFDSNYYVSPTFTKGSIYSYFNSVGADRYLSSWQSYSGQDVHSHEAPRVIPDSSNIIFEYNPTTSPITIALPFNYMDARGVTYNGTITIQPYGSAVLIKNGPIINVPNISPVSEAGSSQFITLPTNTVALSGSGSDSDGTISSYQWTKVSGPSSFNIVNPSLAKTDISALVEGVYQFALAVTDNKDATGKDTVTITVNGIKNISPTAYAGSSQSVTLPINSVSLSGSGIDTDGTIGNYQWTKVSGPSSFNIVNPSLAKTDVSALVEGVYQFALAVTDNKGATGKDTVNITVNGAKNIPPAAHVGANQSVTLPVNSVSLTGSGSDADGTISSYQWTKVSGPSSFNIVNESSPVTDVSGLVQGVYQFQLSVKDNKGDMGTAIIQVSVNAVANQSPVADAGSDKTITLPINSVSLSGSGRDLDGSIASYQWTKISGPSAFKIENPSLSATKISGLVEGLYQFQLTVKDNNGDVGNSTVNVTVNKSINTTVATPNTAPVANAGNDTTIVLPDNSITLNGGGNDTDGKINTYLWKEISGPSEIILPSDIAVASVSNLIEGTYQFELTVTDDKGGIGKDTVNITVALARLSREISGIKVYPNPVQDIATLEINTGKTYTNVMILVTDISGKSVYTRELVSMLTTTKEKIDMSAFVKGAYVITVIFDGTEKQSIKVIRL